MEAMPREHEEEAMSAGEQALSQSSEKAELENMVERVKSERKKKHPDRELINDLMDKIHARGEDFSTQ